MSFIEQWQDQINDSLIECAKLVPLIPDADLKYQLLVVGVLWPIRQPVKDFDYETMAVVQELLGERSKYVLRMVQQWEDDQLIVARSMSAHSLQSGELGAALRHLITYFSAFPIFAKQLASQARAAKTGSSPQEAPTKPSLTLPKVLVSYVSSDGEALGTEVRERLKSEGISIWGDLSSLEGTRDWWPQVTKALDRVDFLVLVMTPTAVRSEMVRKQWRYARQKGVCILPVTKSTDLDFAQLPRWIRLIHFYNLNLEWSKLIKNLKGDCLTPRIPFMVEDLPADFVNRPAELEQMLAYFFDSERQEAIASTVALYGAGGYGKTILARALCHQDDIRQVFDNGILWVSLSENPGDLSRYVIDLIEVLSGERPGFTGLDAAVGRLGELLADRDILLVIDDVWNAAHLKPFLQGGPRCSRLITTRDISVLPPETKYIDVGTMQQDEAVTLLSNELPHGHPGRMHQLADHLGQWPLLLKLANGTLRDRVYTNHEQLAEALTYVDNALAKHGVTVFDIDSAEARDQAVTRTIKISLELLSEEELARYDELAIFPDDVNVPLATVEKLWGATGGLDDFDTEELCDHLHELSLLSHLDLTSRYLRLHKVMRNYLVYQQQDNLMPLHNQLLDAHRPPAKAGGLTWADMSPEEPYLWTYLAYHLIEADHPAELVNLVKNLRYLATKTYLRGTHYTEVDLLAAGAVTTNDKILELLRRNLSQSSHLLVRCQSLNEAANTLHSRLVHLPELAPMAIAAESDLPRPLFTARHILPDLSDPTLIRTLRGHTSGVLACAVSADGSTTVSIAKDNTLMVWDTETGTSRVTVTDHQATLWGCDIAAEGDVIVCALNDGSLTLWDTKTGANLVSWTGHEAGVVSCAISADASVVVSASKDKTLKVWDAQAGSETLNFTERLTLTGHQRTVTCCGINADGTIIVSTSNDGRLNVWDAQTGNLRFSSRIRLVDAGVDRLTFHSQRDISFSCAINATGNVVAATSSTGTVTVWDVETGNERFTLTGDKRGVNDCAFSADGTILVVAKNNSNLKMWDAVTGAELLLMADHARVVNNCALSADGMIIVSASDDKTLKVWDGQSKAGGLIDVSHIGEAHSCATSADGSVVVSAMATKRLKVWDAATATEQLTLKGHTRKVQGCTMSSDGSIIVSASQDQNVIVWDVQTGERRFKLTGHTWAINDCAMSSDGSTIVSASDDKTLKVWDAFTGTERFTLSGHTRSVNGCAVSADGQVIASASGDGTLKIWDSHNGKLQGTLKGHNAWVNSCAISADGKVVVSASYDKTLKVWDIDDYTERFTLQGHTSTITACAISADGMIAVSASRDKSVKVWNTQTGMCMTTLFISEPLVDCASSSDAGSIVAVGNSGIYFLRLDR